MDYPNKQVTYLVLITLCIWRISPMTSAGLAGVGRENAGAASGVINTFHQVGSALGLSILVAIGAAIVPKGLPENIALLGRVNAALVGGSVLLALACSVVLLFIPHKNVRVT